MTKVQVSPYTIISKQIPVAKKIIDMIKAGQSFEEIVAKFLPWCVDTNGKCTIKIQSRKILKSYYCWSEKFDGTMYVPLCQRDLLFTILYELDVRHNPLGRKLKKPLPVTANGVIATDISLASNLDNPYLIEVKVNSLSSAVKVINESKLEDAAKLSLITKLKDALSI